MVRVNNEKNFFFFLISFNLNASIILDHEIEIFINEILFQIKEVNKIDKNINFTILLNDEPNAFVNHKNELFLTSGLIKYTNSYEALLGVLAHEVGHIEKLHISKRITSKNKINNLEKLTSLSIIAGSLITNNSQFLTQSIISNNINLGNYHQSFNRDQEREADYYAIETLNKLNLSTNSLVEFLNLLEKKSLQKGMTEEYFKFSTHPIYKERYNIIKSNKINNSYNFDEVINKKFNYIRGKLFGYTEININLVSSYLKEDFLTYAKSIIYSKEGKLQNSLKSINQIIKKNENNKFLLETKGDILYSSGFFSEALLFYKKSYLIDSSNKYLKRRIFDIEFTNLESKDRSVLKKIFNKNLILLETFYYDPNINFKFKKLASILGYLDWINYFEVDEKFRNKDFNSNEFLEILIYIKNRTNDKDLLKLLRMKIKRLDENI